MSLSTNSVISSEERNTKHISMKETATKRLTYSKNIGQNLNEHRTRKANASSTGSNTTSTVHTTLRKAASSRSGDSGFSDWDSVRPIPLRERRYSEQQRGSRTQQRTIIAIDGEGRTLQDGSHIYT